ncbi:hypothetical protein N7459_003037, partial [Penicillium hispanicum]
AWAATR